MLIVVCYRNCISLRGSSIAKNADDFVLVSSQTVHCVEQSSSITVWIKWSGWYQRWYILQLVANLKKKIQILSTNPFATRENHNQTQHTCPKMVPKHKTKKMNKNPMAVSCTFIVCLLVPLCPFHYKTT